jgi:holin-like protein
MLVQLGTLTLFPFAGELLVTTCGIPFPGPLCGMALLLGYLYVRGGPSEELIRVGSTLIDNLGLLFVPAGTAVIAYGALLARDGLAIAIVLVVSTVAAVLVGGFIAAKGAPTQTADEAVG